MSEKRQMKKIDLATLEQADKRVTSAKIKRGVTYVAILLVVSTASYGAYKVIAGEVVASRFVVANMTCPACVTTLHEVTGKIPGVVEARVSLAAQEVIVKYRNKQTNPDRIMETVSRAGYPLKLDGHIRSEDSAPDNNIVARVNAKPLFGTDMNKPLRPGVQAEEVDPASAFFSAVGKEILLQAADDKTVVIQPYEVEEEVQAIGKKLSLSPEQLKAQVIKNYGSEAKFRQAVAQNLGVRRLLEDYILEGMKDPEKKKRKTLDWVGKAFKDADVRIVDPQLRGKLRSATGESEWERFWPRMINRGTPLQAVLTQ
jgi:copper chaperone CopZ